MTDRPTPPLVVVAGPTGVGKSDLALDLAAVLGDDARLGTAGAEVVNADSMQLYRGMDIGTAKLSPDERRGVPHHLLDVLDVTETASVAAYRDHARAVIERIRADGRLPVLVGGSGLYIQAVLDEIDFPGTDPAVRRRLEGELAVVGPAELHRRVAAADPVAAAAIDPANGRRLVRALEVMELTGRPFTASMPRPGVPRYGAVLLRLDRATEELDQRLGARVEVMMTAGWLDEVRRLDAAGLRRGMTARRALGYAQLLQVLDGELDVDTAVTETVTATRRFVRRQRSWFRRDHRMIDLDAADPQLVTRAAATVRAAASVPGAS
ncbi:tRNA (adenosine(37)-N6)-dimethylallyltransferase MiaA [Nakamurella leprariae]|uniref:tRNA dimethylallyltransferase n=1 Tax=Nakamurella leprariae TaxID=2803911 RepID=A0A938YJW0_9ACTN|nr:tRNA (adenosine(37)-N6)-dimethylallyltransferase MiaA [Nakamurella leprariae]MBM9469218.1 tRNA (adenosine(37)-N6)-dimethylallyltransferase MiaA [Nakamurella leprariae]